MEAIDILDSFLKFANVQPSPTPAPIAPQSNLVQPQLLSGQPPKRESMAIAAGNAAGPSGNAVSVKPATDTKKPLK
jgi:hypothetical protein